jgi:hypothetical protein
MAPTDATGSLEVIVNFNNTLTRAAIANVDSAITADIDIAVDTRRQKLSSVDETLFASRLAVG